MIHSERTLYSESCSVRCNDSSLLACWEGMTMSKGSISGLAENNRCDDAAECHSFLSLIVLYVIVILFWAYKIPFYFSHFSPLLSLKRTLYQMFWESPDVLKWQNNTRVRCPGLWLTSWVSTETLVNVCSSALCEGNQPVITEKTRQVWAAWEMKCTNYCLSVLE